MKKVYLESLGCSKNRVDSEIILGTLLTNGYQFCDFAQEADLIIVNSCSFIEAARIESIDKIFELHSLKKNKVNIMAMK